MTWPRWRLAIIAATLLTQVVAAALAYGRGDQAWRALAAFAAIQAIAWCVGLWGGPTK